MKTAVVIPYFGGIDFDHLQCMNKLKESTIRINIHEHHACPWIDMVQAFLADRALMDPEVDIVFFIEHDMIFNPEDVHKTADRCRNSEFDMIGAAYSQRRPQGFLVGGPQLPEGQTTFTFYEEKLYSASHCGLGFTACKRSLFEKLRETIPKVYCPAVDLEIYPYFAHIISDMYLGQDSSFCRRVNAAGLKIGIDATPRVFHRGLYNYALEDTGMKVPRYEKLIVNNDENCTKGD